MLTTLFGMTTDDTERQAENVEASIVIMLGILACDSAVQVLNALAPMLLTLEGIVTEFNEAQEMNALAPMFVTP
jgi:hypothetical protein